MAINFIGFVYNNAGSPVASATVNLYDRNTTTPVRATTTTDANGKFSIAHGTEGRFDVEIVNGSSKERLKYDDAIQMEEAEFALLNLRNPADTFKYVITPGAIAAERILNLPVLTGTDTLVVLSLAQTLENKLIAFPATQVASADANTLDDYEEGSFTPSIADASLDGTGEGQTYNVQVGRYTKVGNQVTFSLYVDITSLGTLTTTEGVSIMGLPFTSANVSNLMSAITVGWGASLALPGGYTVTGYVANNVAHITVNLWDAADAPSVLLISELSAGGTLIVSGHYRV